MTDPRNNDDALKWRVITALRGSKSLNPIGLMMARTHRYAIEYIEQAPVLVLLAARGIHTKKQAANEVLARSFRVATEGRKLRDALAYYGAPLPMRKLRGPAICWRCYRVIQWLRDVPPSDLSQAIPDAPQAQRAWLDGMVPLIAWAHEGGEDLKSFVGWVAKASAVALNSGQGERLHTRIVDLYDLCRRGRFNANWTFAEAEAAAERWHAELAAEKNTADFVKKYGRAFNEQISYAPLPEVPTIIGGFVFQPLMSAEALFLEGRAMRHCVASYCDQMFRGQSRIYSITAGGCRVATLELAPNNAAHTEYRVAQLRGPCNQPPSQIVAQVAAVFLQDINAEIKPRKMTATETVRRLKRTLTAQGIGDGA